MHQCQGNLLQMMHAVLVQICSGMLYYQFQQCRQVTRPTASQGSLKTGRHGEMTNSNFEPFCQLSFVSGLNRLNNTGWSDKVVVGVMNFLPQTHLSFHLSFLHPYHNLVAPACVVQSFVSDLNSDSGDVTKKFSACNATPQKVQGHLA